MLSQFGVTAGQFLEAGVSRDGLGDKLQFLGTDALAVVLATLVALQQVVGALGEEASRALSAVGLLAEMAADHAIDAGHLLKDLSPFLLERRCYHIMYMYYTIFPRKCQQKCILRILPHEFSIRPNSAIQW